MKEKEVKHVALYLRVSDDKKVNGKRVENEETLRNHREILTAFAERNNYTYETFDEVLSGGISNIEERKQLKRLLDRIEEFDAILVVELSRLSRNGKISEMVLEYCQDYKVLIITPEVIYDLNNEFDAFMYRMGSAMSAHERSIIGKRIKNNKLQLARMGLNASGSVPLGYKRNPDTKKLEIEEEKADIVRYAFKLCNEGYGASRISQALNDAGYTTIKGNNFTTQTIKDMLKTQTYKGFTVYRDFVKNKKNGKTVKEIKDTIIVKNSHPAIISPELFDSIQDIRNKRAVLFAGGRDKPSKKTPPSILKGLVCCSLCGRKMAIAYDGKQSGHLIRRCPLMQDGSKCSNNGMKSISIEEAVLKEVLQYQRQLEEEIGLLESDNTESLELEQESRKKSLEKQLVKLDDQMKGILRLELKHEMQGTSNLVQDEFFREEKQKNIDTKERVQKQLDELLYKMNKPGVQDEIKNRKQTISLIHELDGKSPEQVNTLLKQFIKKIHYTRVIPEEIFNLGAKNPTRKNYPADIEIEYFD